MNANTQKYIPDNKSLYKNPKYYPNDFCANLNL